MSWFAAAGPLSVTPRAPNQKKGKVERKKVQTAVDDLIDYCRLHSIIAQLLGLLMADNNTRGGRVQCSTPPPPSPLSPASLHSIAIIISFGFLNFIFNFLIFFHLRPPPRPPALNENLLFVWLLTDGIGLKCLWIFWHFFWGRKWGHRGRAVNELNVWKNSNKSLSGRRRTVSNDLIAGPN